MNLRNKLLFWMALNRYVDIIVRGVAPLSLPDAVAGSLRYVKAYGGTIQGVPAGYTMLDSVSNRTQSTCDVNTGVYVDVDDVEIEIQVDAKTGSWYIFQSQKTQSALIWGISGTNSGSKISFNWGGTVIQSNITRTSGNTYYVKATAKNGNATLYVKDITDNVEDTVTDTYDYGSGPTSWFGIFGTERNPSLVAGNAVYFAKMSVGGKQVLDAIPAQRQSDGINGFYNKINGQFLIPEELTALNAGTPIVPTPTAPIDITCNNGVLKYSANIANVNAQTVLVGYYISAQGAINADANNWIYKDYIPVSPNTTYTLTMSSPVYYVTISEYSTADNNGFIIRKTGSAGTNTTLTITTGANTNFVRFGTNIDRTVVTLEEVLAINWQLNKGNSMPYTPYSPTGFYTDGTVETIKDSLNNTATAEMLLKVGDYQDVQSIIDGTVTRNVGILVLDGTENWSGHPTITGFLTLNMSGSGLYPDAQSGYCTHYSWTKLSVSYMPDSSFNFKEASSMPRRLVVRDIVNGAGTGSTASNAFKAYLAAQYAAGTPVIIVYPLATPTTESVTGQTLQVVQGDNTLSIIQASMPGLELEAEYTKHE